ncbi:MAG TPA: 50S ribosomal protein L5 [Candidatus Methylomirabilis sp.]|nr:50S ribosomal protein L5 [Candidatus Methylomirabilis sp.]
MNLREQYMKQIAPALAKEFGVPNTMAVPNVTKVTLSVGLSAKQKDPKFLETAETVLSRVSGQKPVQTKAKQSISNFKIRKGQVVGLKVTIRGKRMWDFLERLVTATFPRVRDFRGISPTCVDGTGNFSYGFAEYLAFPEIRPDEVERIHGVEVTLTTTAGTRAKGLALLKALGFPFRNA